MSLQPLSVPENIALYQQGLGAVTQNVLRSNSSWLIMEKRRKEKLRIWKSNNLKLISLIRDTIYSESTKEDLRFSESAMQLWQGKISPLLKVDPGLERGISQNAETTLLEVLRSQKFFTKIHKALSGNTDLTNSDLHFRTTQIDGRPTIKGNNKAIFKSLTSLAHELGHLLVELQTIKSIPTNRHSLTGEILAHCLEEMVGYHYLSCPRDKNQWLKWCRNVDSLNFKFFLWEVGLLPEKESSRLHPSLLPLRQTLYCAPGFQASYALASLARTKHRQKWLKKPTLSRDI